MERIKHMLLYTLACLALVGCNKSEFLSKKSDQSLAQPSKIEDLQAILDNHVYLNDGVDHNYLVIGADDYYNSETRLASFTDVDDRNRYRWSDDIYTAASPHNHWTSLYNAIFYCNVALEGVEAIDRDTGNQSAHDNVRGSALFFRARFYYQLAQLFAPPYDVASARDDWGVVAKLRADVNEPVRRITVQQTYDLILDDMKQAAALLPVTTLAQPYRTRPTRQAALAMLAKTHLLIRDFEQARAYADSALHLQNTLIDYNTISTTLTRFPVDRIDNPEIVFYSEVRGTFGLVISATGSRVDTSLYKSYNDDDLRKEIFFRKPATQSFPADVTFKGNYTGSSTYFSGIAVDELYLIRAEAAARTDRINEAMDDLNHLMIHRWKNDGSWSPFTASNAQDALDIILAERRKELIHRGMRFSDIRRLNREGRNIVQTRIMNEVTYTLLPNDKRYTYLIPSYVMDYNPEMPQNPR